jgi:tetratricopeptide (TPR) repeat protein
MEGKTAQAVAAFKKVSPDSAHYVRALVQMGAAQEDLGKKREAAKTYEKALNYDPKNLSAARNLEQLKSAGITEGIVQIPNPAKEELMRNGLLALESGNFKKALETFRLSRGLLLGDPRPLFYSALALERQKDLKGAIALYERTIESFPDYAPARINQILDLLAIGDRDGAIRNCRKALDALPENELLRSLSSLMARLGPVNPETVISSEGTKLP